jgi:hypothetical protein
MPPEGASEREQQRVDKQQEVEGTKRGALGHPSTEGRSTDSDASHVHFMRNMIVQIKKETGDPRRSRINGKVLADIGMTDGRESTGHIAEERTTTSAFTTHPVEHRVNKLDVEAGAIEEANLVARDVRGAKRRKDTEEGGGADPNQKTLDSNRAGIVSSGDVAFTALVPPPRLFGRKDKATDLHRRQRSRSVRVETGDTSMDHGKRRV